jgi:hypothetical protein
MSGRGKLIIGDNILNYARNIRGNTGAVWITMTEQFLESYLGL